MWNASSLRPLIPAVVVALTVPLGGVSHGAAALSSGVAPAPPLRAPGYGSLPLSFEPNRGQASPGIRYLAHAAGYTLLLSDTGFTLSLAPPRLATALRHRVLPPRLQQQEDAAPMAGPPTSIRVSLVGAARHPRVLALDRRPGIVNYLIGRSRSHWHTDIPTFGRVTYRDVYPGIDLIFYGRGGALEYDWLVGPHADAGRIVLQQQGAQSIRLAGNGDVLLATRYGTVRQGAMHLYQVIAGRRHVIGGGFRLLPGGRLGLHLGRYDHNRPLVIDPGW
jgi:hypothetical protein